MRRLAWPPSSPSASRPFVVEVEDDAARLQVADRGRRLLDQDLHRGGPAEAAAGGDRVGGVALGRVAGLERRRQPALGPEAGALGERRAGDEADAAALLGRAQRGPEAGGAAADDGDVELGGRGYRPSASRRIESSCSRSQAAAPSRARACSSATALLGLARRGARPPRPASRPPRPALRSRRAAPRRRRSPAPSPRARAAALPRGRAAASRGLRRRRRARARGRPPAPRSRPRRGARPSLATSAAACSLRSASSICALRLSPLGAARFSAHRRLNLIPGCRSTSR